MEKIICKPYPLTFWKGVLCGFGTLVESCAIRMSSETKLYNAKVAALRSYVQAVEKDMESTECRKAFDNMTQVFSK
jgi:hypothetical protein